MKYRIIVQRQPEEDAAAVDPIYEGAFDADVDTADEIGTQAGLCIEEAIVCDVALQAGKK